MIKYDVLNFFTGKVQFTAEIDCDELASESVKLGLAIQWGYRKNKPLEGANMAGAYMEGANMEGANMARAKMQGANMQGANMEGAYMAGANMARANMQDANMQGANMAGANMAGAYMAGANMDNPPVSFGCVGKEKRTGFAVWQDDAVMVRLGCFFDTEDKAYAAIRAKYGDDSTYEALVRTACNQVRWYKEQQP